MLASDSGGGYVWAKYGFAAVNIKDLWNILEGAELRGISPSLVTELRGTITAFYNKHSPDTPFPIRRWSPFLFSKDLLMGSTWQGILNLCDQEQRHFLKTTFTHALKESYLMTFIPATSRAVSHQPSQDPLDDIVIAPEREFYHKVTAALEYLLFGLSSPEEVFARCELSKADLRRFYKDYPDYTKKFKVAYQAAFSFVLIYLLAHPPGSS